MKILKAVNNFKRHQINMRAVDQKLTYNFQWPNLKQTMAFSQVFIVLKSNNSNEKIKTKSIKSSPDSPAGLKI